MAIINKENRVGLILLVLTIFTFLLLPNADAFMDAANYDNVKKEYTIGSWCVPLTDICLTDSIKLTLIENTPVCLQKDCVARIKAVSNKDITIKEDSDFLWKFYNDKELNLDYDVSIIEYKDVDDYRYSYNYVCDAKILNVNGTKTQHCYNKLIDTEKATKKVEVISKYYGKNLIAGKEYIIELRANKGIHDNIEWIPTFAGQELNKWDLWNTTNYRINVSITPTWNSTIGSEGIPYFIQVNSSVLDYSHYAGYVGVTLAEAGNEIQTGLCIDNWNASGESFIYANLTEVAANNTYDTIWLYGDPAGTKTYNCRDVFGTNASFHSFNKEYPIGTTSANISYDLTSKNNFSVGRFGSSNWVRNTTENGIHYGQHNFAGNSQLNTSNQYYTGKQDKLGIAFWYKTPGVSYGRLIDTNSALICSYNIGGTGNTRCAFGGDSIDVTDYSVSTYHHLAFSYDGTNWRWYMDGKVVANLGEAIPSIDTYVSLGSSLAGNQWWVGQMDEIYYRSIQFPTDGYVQALASVPTYTFGTEEVGAITVTLLSPTNTTYGVVNTSLLWTASKTANASWYYHNSGSKVMVYGNDSFNGVEGSNQLTFYANDSSANTKHAGINFTIDLTYPKAVTITAPTRNIYANENITATYTYTESNVGNCTYVLNNGQNVTIKNCALTFTFNVTQRENNLTIWINDTTGKANNSEKVTFYVGDIAQCYNDTVHLMPTLNFTIKDEGNDTLIAGDLDGSITYWINNNSVNKTYYYDKSASSNHSFCLYPNWTAITTDYSFQADNYEYPARRISDEDLSLTNTTTQKTVYLLQIDSGIYPRFVTTDNVNTPITNVFARMQKSISGTYTNMEEGYTDNAGLITFWANPDDDYRFIFQKTGYTTQTLDLRPSSSDTYYVNMGGGASAIVYNTTVSENITYVISPISSNLTNGTTYTFWYNISSSSSSLSSYGFKIYNNSISDPLGWAYGDTSSGSNLLITLTLTNETEQKLFAIYNYTVSGTTKEFRYEWIVGYFYTGSASLKKAIDNLRTLTFGSMSDFTRYFIAFLIIFFAACSLSYASGVYSTKGIIAFTLLCSWIASYLQFFPSLPSSDYLPAVVNSFMSQYWIPFILTLGGLYFIFGNETE